MSAEATRVCGACPHACQLAAGQLGRCRARRGGEPESYGRLTSLALDPIEKKPLSRFLPGTSVLSLGSYGCNMDCPFCQNASIARAGAEDLAWRELKPDEIVEMALGLANQACAGIAYTYNEPLVAWEFVRDTSKLAHEEGLVNVLVSNGMASEGVLEELVGIIDAANIDLKCFTEAAYRSLGGDLTSVKRTIERLAKSGSCHVEVTTLVVPGFSDSEGQIEEMAAWLASIDPQIPYHLTRFFPQHRMSDAKPTLISDLYRLAEVALRHLDDVILGNI